MHSQTKWLISAVTMIAISAMQASASAAEVKASPDAKPKPCATAEYRQLDFWVGDWRVLNTADKVEYGTSRIESMFDGCSISEAYSAPQAPGAPYAGKSYSGFDRNDRHWHQMYVDTNGNLTWFTGDAAPSSLVLLAPAKGGALQRMTYRRQDDGSVRQIGEISQDNGKTWTPGYDLTYLKR